MLGQLDNTAEEEMMSSVSAYIETMPKSASTQLTYYYTNVRPCMSLVVASLEVKLTLMFGLKRW